MFWPIVLPVKLTALVLVSFVALLTAFAPVLKWKRGATLMITALLACVAFVPSCTGIMTIVDSQRFGVFQYDAFADVNDFRIERFLPPRSRNITLDKFANGHRARYSISQTDLIAYLDNLWNKYGEYSAIPRSELGDGSEVSLEALDHAFGDLDWPPLENAIELHSPVESDGGGATYFFDAAAGIAYHRAGYW